MSFKGSIELLFWVNSFHLIIRWYKSKELELHSLGLQQSQLEIELIRMQSRLNFFTGDKVLECSCYSLEIHTNLVKDEINYFVCNISTHTFKSNSFIFKFGFWVAKTISANQAQCNSLLVLLNFPRRKLLAWKSIIIFH